MEKVLEAKLKICSGCGKEVLLCDACGHPFEIQDDVVCVVVGFDRVKHYHNYQKCFPKLTFQGGKDEQERNQM